MSDSATQTQTEHAPGSFCWIELATTDGPGAKKFYGEIFGWEAQDNPMGPDMVYTMLKLNGKDVGALYQKGEAMKRRADPLGFLRKCHERRRNGGEGQSPRRNCDAGAL